MVLDVQTVHSDHFLDTTNNICYTTRVKRPLFFMEVIIEGKVKTVYAGDDADRVIIEYHDKVTAGNGEMVDHPLGKGSLCCSISSIIFEKLAKENIPTHYINMVGANKMICKKVDIVPLEVICRNRAAGSIVRETTLQEGAPLPQPIVEFFLKDDTFYREDVTTNESAFDQGERLWNTIPNVFLVEVQENWSESSDPNDRDVYIRNQ